MSVEYENLFFLYAAGAKGYYHFKLADERLHSLPDFEEFTRALYRGEINAIPPLGFVPAKGKKLGGLHSTAFPPLRLMSAKLLEVAKREGLTGLSKFDVVINDEKLNGSEVYGLSILGRAGKRDLTRVVELERSWKEGYPKYKVYKSFFFENDFWDGSDFCLTGIAGTPVVTEKVKIVLEEYKIKNIEFTPLLEFEDMA